RTRAGNGEEALLIAQLASSAALAARLGFRAGGGAAAVACLARLVAWNLDRRLGAGVRLFERDLEVVAQVRATLWTSAAAPAEDIAEPEDIAQVREEVAEVGEDRRIEALGAARVHALVA